MKRTMLLLYIFLLATLISGWVNLAAAQQAGKVYRIGYLAPRSVSARTKAFREGLRKLGYVEGQNLVLEYRSAKGNRERLPKVAAELVRLKVECVQMNCCRDP